MTTANPSAPPQALLFDLGNVLVEIDFERVLDRWASLAGCDAQKVRERFSHDEPYQRFERDEIGAADYFASLRRSLGIELSDAQFLDGWNRVFVRTVPGVEDLVKRAARRLPLYAFSNTNVAHQAHWSTRFAELLAPFTQVFASPQLGLRKPEPEAFHAVARDIGLAPQRILFFDDSLENVDGAHAVGMPAIHVRSVADLHAALEPLLR